MYRSSMNSVLLYWFLLVLCGLGPAVFLTLPLLCSFLTHVFIVIAGQCLSWPFHQFLRVGFHISKENSGMCLCWLPVLFTDFIFVFLTNCVQATNYDPKHSKEQSKNGKPWHSGLSSWDTWKGNIKIYQSFAHLTNITILSLNVFESHKIQCKWITKPNNMCTLFNKKPLKSLKGPGHHFRWKFYFWSLGIK